MNKIVSLNGHQPVINKQPRFTNRALMSYHMQIRNMQAKGSVLIFLMQSKIREFYNNNGLRIKTIDERIGRLERLYFEHDHDDKVVMVGKEKDRVPKLLAGMDIRNYNEAFELLMNEETNIE